MTNQMKSQEMNDDLRIFSVSNMGPLLCHKWTPPRVLWCIPNETDKETFRVNKFTVDHQSTIFITDPGSSKKAF